tara:strand:- start:973 stop:1494 length:522 start_codon:yes stop_codon:yes gene_type:complete
MNYKEQKIKELERFQRDKVFNVSLKKLNQIKNEITLKWGKERIMNLISPELLLRFKRAETKYINEYHAAIDKVKYNEMMTRGYEALIQDAINRGYNALSPEFIFTKHPASNEDIIICVNEDDVPIAFEKYKAKENVIIFHISEILISITEDFLNLKRDTKKIQGRIKSYVNVG